MSREVCEMGDDGIVRCRIVHDDEGQPDPKPEPVPEPDEPETLPDPPRDNQSGQVGKLLQALMMEAAAIKQAIRTQDPHSDDDPEDFKTSRLIQVPRFERLETAEELNAELDRRQPGRGPGWKALHNAQIQNELAKEKARRQAIQMEAVDQQMARLARAIVETAEAQKIQQTRSFRRQQVTAFDASPGIIPGLLAEHGIGQSNLRPMIAESLPIIQDIPGAQKPVTRADYQRQQNALAMERAQRDALYAQQRYYAEQLRQERIQRNQEQYRRQPPNAVDIQRKRMSIIKYINAGRMLSADQLKQIFGILKLQKEFAGSPVEKRKLLELEAQIKRRLAYNITNGPDRLINKDEYVIIGDQAYGKHEALEKALANIDYFQKQGSYIPPKFSNIPPNAPKHIKGYVDLQNDFERILKKITTETTLTFHAHGAVGVRILFFRKFPNNGSWDMQVGHNLPGQTLLRDPETGKPLRDSDNPQLVITADQYAVFNGEVRRAGYFSNYAFGQAAAAGGMSITEAIILANGLALKDNFFSKGIIKLDNPKDIQAIVDGYSNYMREHPMELPSPESFMNK